MERAVGPVWVGTASSHGKEAVVGATRPPSRNSRSAVPRIAATRARAGGRTQRRLDGAYREYARRRRPAPYAAKRPVEADSDQAMRGHAARNGITFMPAASAFDAISQVLQRPLPIRRQFHVAVGRHGGVLLAVRQQQFDDIAAETVLAQQRRRGAARPMRAEVGHAEVDALEEVVQRHVAHRHAAAEDRREDVLAMPRQLVHLAQEFNGLARQEHAVRLAHLHALGRDVPLRGVEVELGPLRAQQFALAGHREHQQLGRRDGRHMRALLVQLAPERPQLFLAQVPVMLDRCARDGTAQRLRRVRRHQQVADRVVVELLHDDADALGGHGGVGARLDDGQHVAGLHVRKLHVADRRVDVGVEPAHDLRDVGGRSIEQRLVDPAAREGAEPSGRVTRPPCGRPLTPAWTWPGSRLARRGRATPRAGRAPA